MVSQQEIADQLGIQRSSVAVHISNLIRKGWIAGKGYVLNSGRYVVVVGGAGMDLMGFSESKLLVGESNPGRTSLSPGGVGRNIAENLAKLGLEVHLFSAVGQDLYGQQLIDRCREAGIDTRSVVRVPGASTALYLALIEPEGEMRMALSSMAIFENLTVEAVRRQDALLSGAAAIVADTNLPGETLAYLISHYRHKPIFIDPVSVAKSGRLPKNLAGIDTLKPNRHELEALTGLPATTPEECKLAAESLCRQGIRRVVVSLGDLGALSVTIEGVVYSEAGQVQVVNATGAGDAFMAGLVYGATHGADDEKSLMQAIAMAEITLESADAIAPLLNENLLNDHLDKRQYNDKKEMTQ